VLKALAFVDRGEPKDAYDLFYLLRNFGTGPENVAEVYRTLLDYPLAVPALEILAADFTNIDGVGSRRLADFLSNDEPEALRADAVVFIRLFLASRRR
jgi:predicted nucleotidyltransferase